MEKLRNIVVGAIVAGVLLGPAAWADDSLQLSTRLSHAAVAVAATSETSLCVQAAAVARAVLPRFSASTRN